MTSYSYPLHLGQAVGVELEYMIVDAETLAVRPIADELIMAVAGRYDSDVEPDGPEGAVSWSNELALHVIELKTARPVAALEPLIGEFSRHVARIEEVVAPMGARLMPTAMHPWMDPRRELKLWPHEHNPVYEAYDRIFSCKGHGWANLQSTHVNLPFGNDEEFGRLHAAIRIVLPIIPALAASSPIVESVPTGTADTRMEVYRRNAKRIPSVTADVIPEPVFTRAEYQTRIFDRMYREIAPHDPDEILRHEWLNARGCIARFDRGAIEIRVIDAQECPAAELAVVWLVTGAVRALTDERWTDLARQQRWGVGPLKRTLLNAVRDAERSVIDSADYLALFGLAQRRATAGELWAHLAEAIGPAPETLREPVRVLIEEGPVARRILRATGPTPAATALAEVYRELCDCLRAGRMFAGAPVRT